MVFGFLLFCCFFSELKNQFFLQLLPQIWEGANTYFLKCGGENAPFPQAPTRLCAYISPIDSINVKTIRLYWRVEGGRGNSECQQSTNINKMNNHIFYDKLEQLFNNSMLTQFNNNHMRVASFFKLFLALH